MTKKILVTDGENKSSLAAVRSLGRNGHNIYVSGIFKSNLSSLSKFSQKCYCVSDPIINAKAFCNDIIKIVENNGIDIIIPMTEPSIFALTYYIKLLPPNTTLASPNFAEVEKAFDKNYVFKLAQKLRIDMPKTIFVSDTDDFLQKKSQIVKFPVVVKPAKSRIFHKNGYLKTSVKYAENPLELINLYEQNVELRCFPSMIQEKITGPGTGLFTLFDGTKHLALFSHERVHEKPLTGGVSVTCKSVELDNEMVEGSLRLLKELNWQGIAMVEFKRDVRDGRAKLMEINGRFWGSLQLAISAGIDFPNLYVNYILDQDKIDNCCNYRVGLRLRWFLGSLDYLILRFKSNDNLISKLKDFFCFLKIYKTDTIYDVFDNHDIKPFIHELKNYFTAIIKKIKN